MKLREVLFRDNEMRMLELSEKGYLWCRVEKVDVCENKVKEIGGEIGCVENVRCVDVS